MLGEIKKITINDKNFPSLLKKIPRSPKQLFFCGSLPDKNDKLVAIVGTRRCSNYGREMAFRIASDLAGSGVTIVSGMAEGIDAAAHQGAIAGRGKTLAVLGTGLEEKVIYPKKNLPLAKKIVKSGGCLLSEYPPLTPGRKFTFLQRNRIIAGLSLGVLVVEAPLKSGALSTAGFAKKYQKAVFALPGSVHSRVSRGCHFLIREKNAILIESAQDILKALNITKNNNVDKEKKFNTPQEEKIFNILKKEGAKLIDEIVEETNLPPSVVLSTLSLMEIEGKVKKLEGDSYCLV